MSYHIENILTEGFPVNNFEDSFTTEEAYGETLKDVDDSISSATIQYKDDLRKQISKAFLLSEEVTEEQLESLISFLIQLQEVEQICQSEIKDISVKVSYENELIFYRKTDKGICFLSIDPEGDILFNFTGYKKGFETQKYNYGNEIDFESLTYNFLAR